MRRPMSRSGRRNTNTVTSAGSTTYDADRDQRPAREAVELRRRTDDAGAVPLGEVLRQRQAERGRHQHDRRVAIVRALVTARASASSRTSVT